MIGDRRKNRQIKNTKSEMIVSVPMIHAESIAGQRVFLDRTFFRKYAVVMRNYKDFL